MVTSRENTSRRDRANVNFAWDTSSRLEFSRDDARRMYFLLSWEKNLETNEGIFSRRDETGYSLSLLVNYVSLWDYKCIIQLLAGLFHTPSSTGWTSLSSVARPPSWVRGMYCRPGTCSWHAVVWFGFGPWRLRGPQPKALWLYFGDLK